jgi:hypothetical protein
MGGGVLSEAYTRKRPQVTPAELSDGLRSITRDDKLLEAVMRGRAVNG